MNDTGIREEIHEYVNYLDILSCQRLLGYVHGIYDGAHMARWQYGLDDNQPSQTTGGTVLKFVKPEGKK